MANDTVGQEKQGNYITQKANILSFQGTTALFALQQGVLYNVTVSLQRAHLRRVDGLGNYRSKACRIACCIDLNN